MTVITKAVSGSCGIRWWSSKCVKHCTYSWIHLHPGGLAPTAPWSRWRQSVPRPRPPSWHPDTCRIQTSGLPCHSKNSRVEFNRASNHPDITAITAERLHKDLGLYLSADLESDSLMAVNCSGGSGPSSSERYQHNVLHFNTLRFVRVALLLLACPFCGGSGPAGTRRHTHAHRNNHLDNYALMPNRVQLFKMCIIWWYRVFLESRLLLHIPLINNSNPLARKCWLNLSPVQQQGDIWKKGCFVVFKWFIQHPAPSRLPQGFIKPTCQRD